MRGGWDSVVGGRASDGHDADSIFGLVQRTNEHFHMPAFVYPWLAAPVTLTDGGVWTLGAVTQIIPAATITSDFDLHYILVSTISAVGDYVLELYYGAADTPCGRIGFARSAVFSQEGYVPITTGITGGKPIPAGSRIRAALASSVGAASADIKLMGHEY